MFCTKCGKENAENMKFCSQCGNPLTNNKQKESGNSVAVDENIKRSKIYSYFYAPYEVRSTCLFVPNCSEYMVLAIEKYGLIKGIRMGLARFNRCKPPYGGVDYP